VVVYIMDRISLSLISMSKSDLILHNRDFLAVHVVRVRDKIQVIIILHVV